MSVDVKGSPRNSEHLDMTPIVHDGYRLDKDPKTPIHFHDSPGPTDVFHPSYTPLPEKNPKENGVRETDITEVTAMDDDDEEYDDWSDDDDDDLGHRNSTNIISKFVFFVQSVVKKTKGLIMNLTRGYLFTVLFLGGYLAYFVTAMCYRTDDEGAHRLIGCTVLGVIIYTRHRVGRAMTWLFRKVTNNDKPTPRAKRFFQRLRLVARWFMYVALLGVVLYVLIDQGIKEPSNLRSLPGLCIFIIVPLLFSTKPGMINWHTIYWGVGMQFVMAVLVLKWKFGQDAVLWIQDRLDEFFANSEAGSTLIFGASYRDHYMIFGALPIVFLSNTTLTLLYYAGAMQFIVRVIGKFLQFVLNTKPVESMGVAMGIFTEGITAILALRPYLQAQTKSEMFVIITSVFSSLGGAYLAILFSYGVALKFLIPSMVVSAPATFVVCKLMIPESRIKSSEKAEKDLQLGEEERSKYANIMDAFQTGATAMIVVVGNISVVSYAFFSYISWINHTLGWFGDRVGIEDLTMEYIFSYLLYPVSLAMGIQTDDCRNVAMLLGYRIASSNFIAFLKLTELKVNKAKYLGYVASHVAANLTAPIVHTRDDIILVSMNETLKNGFISDRSEAIITYCLCGFSSFLTVAVTIGVMFTLVPKRKAWIAKVTVPALIAGNVANCMTGCFASIFY